MSGNIIEANFSSSPPINNRSIIRPNFGDKSLRNVKGGGGGGGIGAWASKREFRFLLEISFDYRVFCAYATRPIRSLEIDNFAVERYACTIDFRLFMPMTGEQVSHLLSTLRVVNGQRVFKRNIDSTSNFYSR